MTPLIEERLFSLQASHITIARKTHDTNIITDNIHSKY
jgi:hypothetical protein